MADFACQYQLPARSLDDFQVSSAISRRGMRLGDLQKDTGPPSKRRPLSTRSLTVRPAVGRFPPDLAPPSVGFPFVATKRLDSTIRSNLWTSATCGRTVSARARPVPSYRVVGTSRAPNKQLHSPAVLSALSLQIPPRNLAPRRRPQDRRTRPRRPPARRDCAQSRGPGPQQTAA